MKVKELIEQLKEKDGESQIKVMVANVSYTQNNPDEVNRTIDYMFAGEDLKIADDGKVTVIHGDMDEVLQA